MCCICLGEIGESESVCMVCCKQYIHTLCLLQYISSLSRERLLIGIECPLCRSQIKNIKLFLPLCVIQKYTHKVNLDILIDTFYHNYNTFLSFVSVLAFVTLYVGVVVFIITITCAKN
ncbi:RING-H2 finger protein [bacterium]|nr:RING-H2 finger protein [bacterium]NDG30859.1 RING-H2 finger protein [bacterium]